MKRKLAIVLACIVTLAALFFGCAKSGEGFAKGTPSSAAISASPGATPTIPDIRANDLHKNKDILEAMPKLVSDVRSVLLNNSTKLWPGWDNSKLQVMLLNPSNDVAYLLNNQKADLGPADTDIKYSAQTVTATNMQFSVMPFGEVDFNGFKTYFVNVDMTAGFSYGDKDAAYKQLFKLAIHEAVHIFLQSNQNSAEMAGMRANDYPVDVNSRYYRNESFAYLKDAAKTDVPAIDNLKKANYFYEKYLAENEKNRTMNSYDAVEGQANYICILGWLMLSNPNADAKALNRLAQGEILNDAFYGDDSNTFIQSDNEFYSIGALSIANMIALGDDVYGKIPQSSPLELMNAKYGTMEGAEHSDVKTACLRYYDDYNKEIKSHIDAFNAKEKDPNNIALKIPVTFNNQSATFDLMNIAYTYKGQPGIIQRTNAEILLGGTGNRVKLTDAEIINMMAVPDGAAGGGGFTIPDGAIPPGSGDGMNIQAMPDDAVMSNYILFIPKSDVQIKNGLLTIQRDDIAVFDAKFTQEGNEITLLVK